MIIEHVNFYLHIHSWMARIPLSSLHFKLKSCTLLSSLLQVKFSGGFCSDIESISTILSTASNKTNSYTPFFLFYFLRRLGVLISGGLDFESLWIVGTGCNCHSTGVDIFYHIL